MQDFSDVVRNKFEQKDYERLRCAFPSKSSVERNYSQALQDMFVVCALQGKKKGTYVEIGSGPPININNSYFFN